MGEEIRGEDGNVLISDDVKRQLQHGVQRRTVLIVLTCVIAGGAVVALLLFAMTKFLFSVEEINCPDTEYYTAKEILEAADLQKGMPIFLASEKKIKERVLSNMPFLEDVKVKKVYPDTLVITPTEEEPLFYFVADIPSNEYVVVSANQKVLKMFDEQEEMLQSFPAIFRVSMPSLLYIAEGQKLGFANRGDSDYIPSLVKLLEESDFEKDVLYVDAANRFELMVYCQNENSSYRIYLGNKKDLYEKLFFAEGIKERIPKDFSGLIGVENPTEGYADPDNH